MTLLHGHCVEYMPSESHIYEPTFFTDMSVKLERFFVQIVLPDMLVGNSTSECSAQSSHQ